MIFSKFLIRQSLSNEEVIIFLISIQACSRISTPLAIESYKRELTADERLGYEQAHNALLQSNRLVTIEQVDRVRPVLEQLANYLLSLKVSPLCDANGCGFCSHCEEWEFRRQVFYKVLRAARKDD